MIKVGVVHLGLNNVGVGCAIEQIHCDWAIEWLNTKWENAQNSVTFRQSHLTQDSHRLNLGHKDTVEAKILAFHVLFLCERANLSVFCHSSFTFYSQTQNNQSIALTRSDCDMKFSNSALSQIVNKASASPSDIKSPPGWTDPINERTIF